MAIKQWRPLKEKTEVDSFSADVIRSGGHFEEACPQCEGTSWCDTVKGRQFPWQHDILIFGLQNTGFSLKRFVSKKKASDMRLSQCWLWRVLSSGIWRCEVWWKFSGMYLLLHIYLLWIYWHYLPSRRRPNVGELLPDGTELHRTRQ
jgi:hypothetical protein